MDQLYAIEIAPQGWLRQRLSGGLSGQGASDVRLTVVISAMRTLEMQILTRVSRYRWDSQFGSQRHGTPGRRP
jgi:hypothetical protein